MAKAKTVDSQPKKESIVATSPKRFVAKERALKQESYIYELVSSAKDFNTGEKKFPVIHMMPSSGIVYDPESDTQRRIKYVRGEQSIFEDEQSQEAKSKKNEPIVFSRGLLVVPRTNPLLKKYLDSSNLNSSNPNRIHGSKDVFYLIDKGEDAKVTVQKTMKEVEAASVALKMPLEQLLGYARVLGVNVDKSTDEIRYDMMQIAKKDPKSFVDGLDDPRTEYAETFILAKEYGILNNSKKDISWINGGIISVIPIGVSPVDKATDFFMSEEGEAVYKEVRRRLESTIG